MSVEAMTPREHLDEVKRLFVEGQLSVREARALDSYWRLQLIAEPTPGQYLSELTRRPRMFGTRLRWARDTLRRGRRVG